MPSPLMTRLTQALGGIISEAREYPPGRGYADLKDTIGPIIGLEAYQNILKQEAELRRNGQEQQIGTMALHNSDTTYRPPLSVTTQEPVGPTDQYDRVIPWTEDEVIVAMEPFVRKIISRYFNEAWKNSGFDIDDALAMGNWGILQAFKKDEGRPGNSFPTFAKQWIQSAITQGIGDPAYKRAKGVIIDVLQLATAAKPDVAQNIEDLINGKVGSPNLKDNRLRPPLFATEDNKYDNKADSDLLPFVQKVISNVIAAVKSGDDKQLAIAKRDGREAVKTVSDMEAQNRTSGGKTSGTIRTSAGQRYQYRCQRCGEIVRFNNHGRMAPIWRPNQAPSRCDNKMDDGTICGNDFSELPPQQENGPKHVQAMDRKNMSGEMEIRPDLPFTPDTTTASARRDTIQFVLKKAGLSTRESMIIARMYGIADYPGKGTSSDPEIDTSVEVPAGEPPKMSRWATPDDVVWGKDAAGNDIFGYGFRPLEKNEIADEFGVSYGRISQQAVKAQKKMVKAGEGLEESHANDLTDEDVLLLRETRLILIKSILEEIASTKVLYS